MDGTNADPAAALQKAELPVDFERVIVSAPDLDSDTRQLRGNFLRGNAVGNEADCRHAARKFAAYF